MSIFSDLVSFLLLLLLTLPILALSGSLRDLFGAFSIAFSRKRQSTTYEMKRAVVALKLCRSLLLYSGMFWALAAMIVILSSLDSLEKLGPGLAVAILTLLYACALCILLLPVQASIEKKLLSADS